MKKIISVVLALMMLFSMLTTVSAATVENLTAYVPNPAEMVLEVAVSARKSGETDYTSALAIRGIHEADGYTEVGVDYKATLNMEPVRNLFDGEVVNIVLANDQAAQAEFNAGIVKTTVKVVIDYPTAAIAKADLNSAGVLDAGSIFSQKSRNIIGNKVTITYENAENLTVADIAANKEAYLKDISFTLDNAIAYASPGSHKVSVTLSGSTTIDFSPSKDQVINYMGGSSYIVNYTEDVLEHTLEVVPLVPATCISEGSTEGVKCATHDSYTCGALGTVEPTPIPMISHMLFSVPRIAPTCASVGMEAHDTCSFCKKDFVNGTERAHDSLIIPVSSDHTGLVTIPGTPADCTKAGLTDGQKCTTCGKVTVVQTVIPATGHSEETIPAVPADCITDGKTEGKQCSVCDVILVAQTVVPATGHDFGEWTVTRPATELEKGEQQRTCNNCGTVETAEIPKLTHTHVIDPKLDVITQQPTCTETGLKQQYCGCGEAVGTPVSVPALNHANAISEVPEIPATCVTAGTVRHYVCGLCNATFRDAAAKKPLNVITAPINPRNHGGNEVVIPAVPATCEEKGLTEGKKCSACNVVTEKQRVEPKKQHDLFVVPEESATCEENGVAEHKHCRMCNKDFKMNGNAEIKEKDFIIPATGHKYGTMDIITPPGETTPGEGKYVCQNDSTHVKNVVIKATGHIHNETKEEIITPATCDTTGLKRVVYTCCGEVKEDNIVVPEKAHTPVFVPTVDATCHAEGVAAHYKCADCGKLFASVDMTEEITAPARLDKKEHNHIKISETREEIIKQCPFCQEIIRIKKENNPDADIKGHGGFKDERDNDRADVHKKDNKDVKTETNIKIEKREEVSEQLDIHIPENAAEEKVVFDITIEKETKIKNNATGAEETEREIISRTEDLVIIEIMIPPAMRGMVDYVVHRLHIEEDGTEVPEVLTTRENAHGEYIELDLENHKIVLHVRRFSEYAVVGYNEVVNPPAETTSTSTLYTVTFKANGGTVVNGVNVRRGAKITAPETTREGYIFDGWYTNTTFTTKFDFDTPITRSITLYANWIEESKTPMAPADFDKFVDLGGYEWAEVAINYLAYTGVIKGVTDTTYEPGMGIKRGDVALLMVRQFGLESDAAEEFEDILVDYYRDACRIGKAHGILLGVNEDNTLYEPERTILREEMAALIVRSLVTMGHIDNPTSTDVSKYADAEDIEEYAVPYVAYLTEAGIVQGDPSGEFRPKDTITRAEAAQIIYNLYKLDIEGLLD